MILTSSLGNRKISYTYTESDDIQSQSLVFTDIPYVCNSYAMAYNPVNEMVYWADPVKIMKIALDGTNYEVVINMGAYSMSLDVERQNVYFVAYALSEMSICDVNGMNNQGLFMTGSVISMDFDESSGYIYYCLHYDSIQRFHRDNPNTFSVVVNGICDGLSVDHAGQVIFWTDVTNTEVWSVNSDGSNKQQIVPTLSYLGSYYLMVIGNFLYTRENSGSMFKYTYAGDALGAVAALSTTNPYDGLHVMPATDANMAESPSSINTAFSELRTNFCIEIRNPV
ncbi:uncharacterized protein [Antedon mediterranea]|uniref:uncharacterized protein n=1 Tax=Antedon mediterranea TaxID=105859 RepID=UPI003AF680F2